MLSLVPATQNDFNQIEELAKDIWPKHYAPIIGLGQVNYMLNKLYSSSALKKQTEEGQVFYLVMNDASRAGFVSISNKGQGDYFLHKFYILQDKQNTGVGTLVFHKLFAEMNTPSTIRLTVNRQNFKAINFYFTLGFKIEKVEDFDIGNGYFMNDFVMLWKKN